MLFSHNSAYGADMTAAIPFPDSKPPISKKRIENLKQDKNAVNTKGLLKNKTDQPLNNYQLRLYREIFKAQAKGNWRDANIYIRKIDNPVLIGHVLIQRYQHPGYKTSQNEYIEWMRNFKDHPQSKIVDQILRTGRSTYQTRVNGTLEELRYFSRGSKYISDKYKSGERYELNLVRKMLAEYLSDGKVSAALNAFETHKVQAYIDPIDKSQILAEIASYYLYLGHPKQARATSLKALKASDKAPLAGWVMGLASYINGDMATAAKYFTVASNAPYASPWMTSAAAYWAGRAYMKDKNFPEVTPMLTKAVQNQRTFYGLLATKTKGYGFDFNWTMPTLDVDHKRLMLKNKVGARILALAETGQLALAEDELFALPVKDDPALAEAALAVAHHYNLAAYALRFSSSMNNPAGGYYDSGLFPISSWTKDRKYKDQALLNAFIRQESKFRIGAKNPTGATGLMQVMPATAAYITKDDVYKTIKGQKILSNPAKNIDIGSAYLEHLLELKTVDNDLFSLAIAYNAGPGNLSRWKKAIGSDDPLLFIELIPSSETRAFVERIMTNYWIYQMQMGIEPYTLQAVAEGRWPKLDN